jgi:hypothetical protein
MIVISKDSYPEVNDKLTEILKSNNIKPKRFKWNKFNSMDKVNALKEFLRYLFRLMSNGKVHIHTIIWDIKDSRHDCLGRDDTENLSLMYYKLIKNFAEDKLKNGDTLTIYPDRNNSIDWSLIEEILPNDGIYNTKELEYCTVGYSKVFIKESNTSENALIQIADIFAGLARTSHEDYDCYEKWLNRGHTSLFGERINEIEISVKDEHRFKIYKFIDEYSKRKSWKVSLKTKKGFTTYKDNDKPLNFWFYEPQHEEDKAPLKNK